MSIWTSRFSMYHVSGIKRKINSITLKKNCNVCFKKKKISAEICFGVGYFTSASLNLLTMEEPLECFQISRNRCIKITVSTMLVSFIHDPSGNPSELG